MFAGQLPPEAVVTIALAIDCRASGLLRRITPLPRRDTVYFCSDAYTLAGELRMLATLEAATGVLYVAITVAVLVSSYRLKSS